MKTKTILTIILATMAIISSSAQNKIVKQNHNLATFSSIAASSGWDIIISQGDRQSISTEVSDNIAEHMSLEVKNGTLHIGSKRSAKTIFSNRGKGTIQKAYITVTNLNEISASGGVDVYFKTIGVR